MTCRQHRVSRRAVLAGAAGAGAVAAYAALSLRDDGAEEPPGSGPTAPHPDETGQTVDLTVRWRQLEPRAEVAGLAAGWQFDEESGYSFADVSGNGQTLFVTGTRWNTTDSGLAGAIHRCGLRGGAVYLDGSRRLETEMTTSLTTGTALTVSCRMRADALPSGRVLVVRGGGFEMALEPDGSLGCIVYDALAAQHVIRSASRRVDPRRWTLMTLAVDPTAGVLRLFLDGEESAHTVSRPFEMPATPARLVVGRGLVGAIDELAIYRDALTAQQVRHLHVVGLPKVFTQTSESIDEQRDVFTLFKGSDPVPHPVSAATVMTQRFAASAATQQGASPDVAPAESTFVPGPFGGSWRATSQRLTYRSPLEGDDGTFEAWYRAVVDPADPHRTRRKDAFHAVGRSCSLTLYTEGGRWRVDVRRRTGRVDRLAGPSQVLVAGTLEHVAVSWGRQPDGRPGVALFVDGSPAAYLTTRPGDTTYGEQVALGGTQAAPAYCLFDDVRISDRALGWGEVCPRGHARAGTSGLDLRDRFDRPAGAAPMLWRAGSGAAAWSHQRKDWEVPERVGDDPDGNRALFQGSPVGLHPAYHPDAFGHASSIEAGVAFAAATDGWAGLFVQSGQVGGEFSGVTFMLSPSGGALRLVRFEDGRIVSGKVLRHDFAVTTRATYEMTLTCSTDGIARGFIDGSNVISMRAGAGWPTQGYAGMLTENCAAFFSNLHFCALTPATPTSRVIRTRVDRYGEGASVATLDLVPFRWHKRRGLLPWQYVGKTPEPAGNIAGGATSLPLRPIPSAHWRSEDSANSDLLTIDGRVLYFLRGNPRIADRPAAARIGVLHSDVTEFDALHFTDPNAATGAVRGGTLLLSDATSSAVAPPAVGALQLNAPSTAYAGNGRLLFLGRESARAEAGAPAHGAVVYSRYDVRSDSWEHREPQPVAWSEAGGSTVAEQAAAPRRMSGSPEIVSLREPDRDTYQAVVFQQTGGPGRAVMATALLTNVSSGTPELVPGTPVHTSLARPSGRAIYGFRVLFDNGIYYLHYNEGPQVPDWPARFVLAATLDPYAGPWVCNPATRQLGSAYFRRGSAFEPDNGAIWQGSMFKHRGRYYTYYEAYHSVGDVNAAYANYADPQAGSRVGFATA